MRIAFIVDALEGYGVQKTAFRLARILDKKDDVFVDYLVINGKTGDAAVDLGSINLIETDSKKISHSSGFIRRYQREFSPDIIYSPLLHYGVILIILFKILRRGGVRLVVSAANDLKSSPNSLRSWLSYFLAKLLFRKADKVIALTEKMKDDFIGLFHVPMSRISKINNPASYSDIQVLSHERVDHPFFYEKTGQVLIGVGRLNEQKGFTTLIKAFSLLPSSSVKLIILGEGGERPLLEGMIKGLSLQNRVSMPGFMDNPFKYIARADLFVLSSIFEGFGNVIVEALACGTEVVSTDCPCGPSEILEQGKYGVFGADSRFSCHGGCH